MTGLEGKHIPRRHLAGGKNWRCIAAGLALLLSFAAAAQGQPIQGQPIQGQPIQEQQPAPNPNPQANAPAAPRPPPTGVLETIGRWIDNSVSTTGAGISAAWHGTIDGIGGIGGQAGTAAKDAADAATTVGRGAVDVARGAADVAGTAARLPLSRVVSGRERCTIAPNGAPDCRGAADALCKSKGFASGASVDFENAENCPAQVLLAGKSPEERNCPIEYFVTKSLCQ